MKGSPRQNRQLWRGIATLLLAAAVATGTIASGRLSLVRLLEWSISDQFFQLRPLPSRDRRLAIVTIGEADLRYLGDWPISDRIMARLLRRIAADEPRAIGLDIYRDIPEPPGHQELQRLWQQLPNVVGIEKVAPPPIAPPPFLDARGQQVAASDLYLDLDGRIRRFILTIGGQETLGIRLARLYLQEEGLELEAIDETRKIYQLGQATFYPLRPGEAAYQAREVGGSYQILANYRGDWRDSFPIVPLRAVLPDLDSEPGGALSQTVLPANFFHDRLVLIGAEAPSLKDTYLTPASSQWFSAGDLTPGVAIHASLASQTIAAALDGRPLLMPLPLWANRLWIGGCALCGAILARYFLGARVAGCIGLLALLGATVVVPFGGFLNGWLMPIFKPAAAATIAAALGVGLSFWERLQQSYRDLEKSNQTLETKVEQRTLELAAANAAISKLNRELQKENLRLEAEIDITRRMQQLILPKAEELEAIPGLDVATYMKPATEVGGDYYDVFARGPDTLICIGDVTGHGLESGILMLMAQTGIRALAESNLTDPVRFLDTLNRTLYNNLVRMNSEKNMTLAVLVYRQGRLQIGGQHEEAIVVRSEGHYERVDTLDLGFPIGLDADIAAFISQQELILATDDIVLLYTDGITEAESPGRSRYGIERLCEVACRHRHASAQGIVDAVIADVRAHIGHQQVYDDITLVALKQLPLPAA